MWSGELCVDCCHRKHLSWRSCGNLIWHSLTPSIFICQQGLCCKSKPEWILLCYLKGMSKLIWGFGANVYKRYRNFLCWAGDVESGILWDWNFYDLFLFGPFTWNCRMRGGVILYDDLHHLDDFFIITCFFASYVFEGWYLRFGTWYIWHFYLMGHSPIPDCYF